MFWKYLLATLSSLYHPSLVVPMIFRAKQTAGSDQNTQQQSLFPNLIGLKESEMCELLPNSYF